ncbi:sigma 54-interacting transcriptional regulator [Lentibacillus jeotgali]|uniref:sigma 54-interacting transcriptional regulator n=1 Tax=Lentibacillus jeotgali TaxID=558169 RepID=UPI00026283F5|nr:sigma 54-interacting transcriptional regulator [Lentibacillus jeotgali]
MSVNILVITHQNFSSLVYDAKKMVNLPFNLDIIEVEFGELNNYIDTDSIMKYDLVITSGAHLEFIHNELKELTYHVSFYPLEIIEADLVQSLVKASNFGQNIILMTYANKTHELKEYVRILDVNLIQLGFKNLDDATNQLREYKSKGYYTVIGTSSVCQIARDLGMNEVLIYSTEYLKMEFIKAYQLASTKHKMISYAKIKKSIFTNTTGPVFMVDKDEVIMETNTSALTFLGKAHNYEIIGEEFKNYIDLPSISQITSSQTFRQKQNTITVDPIIINSKIEGYIIYIQEKMIYGKSGDIKQLNSLKSKYKFENIIYKSQKMKKVILKSKQYATSDAPVLISGESGTGKELLAHSIHQKSSRNSKPFLPVNCSAIPQNILESELFGYEEGAFTGTKKGGKPGYFELAQNGTIFLDEIGELPFDIQTVLLRVLQEKEVIRLGGNNIIPLNVRVITATNKSLVSLIQENKFRSDLYYRVNVLQLNIPPLRERKEDIIDILSHLLKKYGFTMSEAEYLISSTRDSILFHTWPGNIRELDNFVQRFTALRTTTNISLNLVETFNDILYEFLEEKRRQDALSSLNTPFFSTESEGNLTDSELEKIKINNVLFQTSGNKNRAAERLGVSRTTLWRKIKQYNLEEVIN